MTFLAFFAVLILAAADGWLLLCVLEGRSPVLRAPERLLLGVLAGLAVCTLAVFLLHLATGLLLSRLEFTLSAIGLLIVLGLANILLQRHAHPVTVSLPADDVGRTATIIVSVLLGIAVLKIIIAALTFLVLTPTYLDDTVDNWNLRGKVFFEDQALTLVMPKEDPATSPLGVSSYPPTVPLLKTWLAATAGRWTDPLVNAIHIVWCVIAAGIVFLALRRIAGRFWALLGTYLLLSLPLYAMHATNTYADVFLSAHVLAALFCLLFSLRATDAATTMTWLRLTGFFAALLPFTKNEGLLIYLPPLLLLGALSLVHLYRRRRLTTTDLPHLLLWIAPLFPHFFPPFLTF